MSLVFMARLVILLLALLAVAAVAGADTLVSPASLPARLRELRKQYAPFLRSLPRPLTIRRHTELSGPWRWKFEAADLPPGPRPPAPDWYRVDLDDSAWEPTTVPEWRYDTPEPATTTPASHRPESRIAWYRTHFAATPPGAGQRVFLTFGGVAWEAEVWLNGTFLGRHTAYWEPFRFEVTGVMRAQNVLAVRVLAGTNLGEPTFGWTVLPCALAAQPRHVRDAAGSVVGQRLPFGYKSSCFLSGFGLLREVGLETTGPAVLSDVLVRYHPQPEAATVRVHADVTEAARYTVTVQMLPENCTGTRYTAVETVALAAGTQPLTLTVPMPGARRWQPDSPCLYRCRVLLQREKTPVDGQDALFGCRTFRLASDTDGVAGRFLLNEQPIYLRGADASPALNALWYWRQPDRLLTALLMLKAAHFNALRACEHIQFPEVRELLDRLGVLSEQDVVGAGYCPAPMSVLAELSARAARLCYNNPSVVLLTAGGSETNFDPRETVAAVQAVDPERVMKPISGHMESWGSAYELPPGYPTLPADAWTHVVDDFHCYNGWYRRGAEIWTLSKRYAPARLVTVGEFGAEALDGYATMQRYPALLQPPAITAPVLWGHAQVKRGDPKLWEGGRGQEPHALGEHIAASQQYQADVLAEQATGFRLSPRRISGYFVFHYLDALPAEWPKSIISFDLTPKAGYYALAQINQPLAPLFQLTNDGRTLALWVANDRETALPHAQVAWRIRGAAGAERQGTHAVDVAPLDATPVTTVDLADLHAGAVTVELTLRDARGHVLAQTCREVYPPAWQPPRVAVQPPRQARIPRVAEAGGDPDTVDWARATLLDGWRQAEGGPTRHAITARAAHDGRFLYLSLIDAVPGADLHADDGIWNGDDWELFFAGSRGKPYRQLGVNPRGKLLDLPSDPALGACGARAVSEVATDHWTVRLALPLATLVSGGVQAGGVIYGNVCRQAGGGDVYRELLAWSPNYAASFHQPERFAELTLE
jgi:hypothetical protein